LHSPLLAPIAALVLWSLAMQAWLYATRIPAIMRHKIVYDPQAPNAVFHAQIPAPVRWKADNYNNLMEQPTLFYATLLVLAFVGVDGTLDVVLAWLYVALRIVHSLWQALVNTVLPRFSLYIAGSIVLLALALHAAVLVF
jgi:hypothetical protein